MPLRDEIDIDSVVFKTLLIDTITDDPTIKKKYKYTGEVNADNLPDGYGVGILQLLNIVDYGKMEYKMVKV